MACPGSFLSYCLENHPDPKSGQYLDPDKLGCAMCCRGDVTDPTFLCAFLFFVPNSPTFLSIELALASAPMEHPQLIFNACTIMLSVIVKSFFFVNKNTLLFSFDRKLFLTVHIFAFVD